VIEEVKTIYEMNARQVVEQMRQAADKIESGKCEFEIRGAILILAGRSRSVDVYSWGELDNFSTLGVLARAEHHVHKVIEG
jgi:chaperonin GroEL (HSP60 family)